MGGRSRQGIDILLTLSAVSSQQSEAIKMPAKKKQSKLRVFLKLLFGMRSDASRSQLYDHYGTLAAGHAKQMARDQVRKRYPQYADRVDPYMGEIIDQGFHATTQKMANGKTRTVYC